MRTYCNGRDTVRVTHHLATNYEISVIIPLRIIAYPLLQLSSFDSTTIGREGESKHLIGICHFAVDNWWWWWLYYWIVIIISSSEHDIMKSEIPDFLTDFAVHADVVDTRYLRS